MQNIARLTHICREIPDFKYSVYPKVLYSFVSLSVELVFIGLGAKGGNKLNINAYKSHKIFTNLTYR